MIRKRWYILLQSLLAKIIQSGMKKYQQNCVDVTMLKEECPDHLLCCICLQLMTEPRVADCQASARHVFGANCIKQWVEEKTKKNCPLCRNVFTTLQPSAELAKEIEGHTAKCKDCQAILPVTQINKHIVSCQKRLVTLKQRLTSIVTSQIAYIDKQINPHLKQSHAQIYEKYVQNWIWLHHDTRNWKWWWWCNNPWWANKSCPTCNTLWHKYEVEIDALQARRITTIEELKLGQEEIEEEKEKEEQGEQGEVVRCANQ